MGGIQIGYRVGRLTVKEATRQRRGGYILWKCSCDCGGEIILDTRCLRRGTVRDCGCTSVVAPGQRDIAGRRFGRLIAIHPTKERSARGSVLWLCHCNCGNEILAEAAQLISGNRKSCGCLSHPPRKDLIGKRFGMLTVMEYAGKEAGMHRWRCLCDCGKETVVGQTLLQTGKTKSCGCLQAITYRSNLQLTEGTSVTRLKASKSGRLIKSNTSGYNGVYYNKKTKLWVAQITFQKKTKYLGSFVRLEDAVIARRQGERIYDAFLQQIEAENGPGIERNGTGQATG